MSDVVERIEKLSPKAGDVIAIWIDRNPSPDLIERIRRGLPDDVSVAMLRTGTKIELIDEEQMRQAGWIRADSVLPYSANFA